MATFRNDLQNASRSELISEKNAIKSATIRKLLTSGAFSAKALMIGFLKIKKVWPPKKSLW
ncbi:hypothetical protein ADICYQ_2962 [Cyclobacterium qasimii M12-11B]|uniref:Uncharacterized protein n=1 Tax=Cyclobacterium qasimii M12-11B TaxID=641524 RepID=S7VCB3_9BACT|nr:hypothetical protein ADICYQ_2962 [Cyclobacterium qasimii M12-11B]